MNRVFAVHAGSRGFDSHRRHMSERFFRSNTPGYSHLVCSELENSVSEWRSVIAVSLNVGSSIRLIKLAKVYMCAHKHYKYDKDGRTAPGVRGHGSLTLSHSGNVVTRIGLQQQRSRVDRAAWLWSSKSRKVVSLRLRHPMTVKPALNGYFF